MNILILGHGYSASALTPRLVDAGWHVVGTTRGDPERVVAAGAEPLLWPGDDARLRTEIAGADAILTCVAPDSQLYLTSEVAPITKNRHESTVAAGFALDPVLRCFSESLRSAPARWVGYLSSTSVYGDHGGAWVDEATPPTPSSPRAAARLAAEHAWSDLARDAVWPLIIFRLAGIYGPGRGPLAKLRRGTARRIVKSGQVFSRVHVEDIAGAILASLQQVFGDVGATVDTGQNGRSVSIYNLCDDAPAAPEETLEAAARLLGVEPPPKEAFETADLSPMARSFMVTPNGSATHGPGRSSAIAMNIRI